MRKAISKRAHFKRARVNIYSSFLQRSGWVIVCAFFFLACGISCGAFTEVLMTPDQKTALTEYLSGHLGATNLAGTQYQDIFVNSLKNNLILLLLMALPPLVAIGFPLTLAVLTYKGMTIGFSSALLIENMSYKGTALTLVSMVPQNLVILPAMFAAAVISVNMSFLLIGGGFYNIRKNLSQYAGSYLSLHFIVLLALILGAFIEAFVCPALIKLIM